MNWVRANYDRVALIAAAAILLVCSVLIFRSASNFDETFAATKTAPPASAKLFPTKSAEIEQALQKVRGPSQWVTSGRSGLFVPEKHFIGADGQPTTLKNTQLHPPVPNEWFEEFTLPLTESDVLTQDPDGDGFNNLEEWQGHSNPIDKTSHPSYLTKLKLKSFSQEPFPLTFPSWVGDTFAINFINHEQPTQFVKIGDTIAGTKFKPVKFTEKYEADKYGTKVDVSELTIENLENHSQVVLVKEKTATSPESVANFIYSWSGTQPIAVKKDQEFSLKPETEIKYKLIDVQKDKAVIINLQKPTEKIEIGLLAP
jgi:hypothetical protein